MPSASGGGFSVESCGIECGSSARPGRYISGQRVGQFKYPLLHKALRPCDGGNRNLRAASRPPVPRSVNKLDSSVRRGDIFYADLSPVVGSEQGGVRPVLIIQNDMGNRHSPTVIAAAITSQMNKAKLPTHIELIDQDCGLTRDSVVLLEQVRTLDKRRLRERMGRLGEEQMKLVDTAIEVSFGLKPRKKLV